MKKIGNIYILTEKEMDALRYELDKCRQYKILALYNLLTVFNL